jgi:alkanesulfonate monooxygenase SsuD/methylene tetrahydromethanopterin reductase-like flavin-dependent oxidoreductase (luciferase family)
MKASEKAVWAQLIPSPKPALVAAARRYESARVEGVWSPQLFGAPFGTLSAVAAVTERLKLGTGIALAFVRSPLETACSAIDLDLLSGGRCVLGLGSSAESQIAGSFGSVYGKPLAHMREIVAMIRDIVARGHSGELGRLDGQYHHLDLSHFRLLGAPCRPVIPIYLPAVFEKACAQAGEIADGLLGHPIWNDAWIHGQVTTQLRAGLDRGARARSDVDLNLMVFTVITEDRRAGIAAARPTIAYYSQSPQYLRYFEAIGFGREAAAIQAAFARHDYAAMFQACTDAMIDSIALIGTADEVRRRMQERARDADSITPVVPHYNLPEDQAAEYAERIAALFYG